MTGDLSAISKLPLIELFLSNNPALVGPVGPYTAMADCDFQQTGVCGTVPVWCGSGTYPVCPSPISTSPSEPSPSITASPSLDIPPVNFSPPSSPVPTQDRYQSGSSTNIALDIAIIAAGLLLD